MHVLHKYSYYDYINQHLLYSLAMPLAIELLWTTVAFPSVPGPSIVSNGNTPCGVSETTKNDRITKIIMETTIM